MALCPVRLLRVSSPRHPSFSLGSHAATTTTHLDKEAMTRRSRLFTANEARQADLKTADASRRRLRTMPAGPFPRSVPKVINPEDTSPSLPSFLLFFRNTFAFAVRFLFNAVHLRLPGRWRCRFRRYVPLASCCFWQPTRSQIFRRVLVQNVFIALLTSLIECVRRLVEDASHSSNLFW